MNIRRGGDYIQGVLKIKNKKGEIVPFHLNEPQKKLYRVIREQSRAEKPIRVIILKARQMGFSTLTEALIFHRTATRENVNSMIVAHKEEATANLFRMSKLFYELLPEMLRPMIKASNAQELLFENPTRDPVEKQRTPGLRSRIRCATAGGSGIGRSDTITNLHLSEYAFWSGRKEETLSGLLQAVPNTQGTMVIIESTANGYEDFKERWDAAVAGENDFAPVFFAWFELEEYRMPFTGEPFSREERELQALYGLGDDQLEWRRWCIKNNCGGDLAKFQQEYPSCPEEAFLSTGKSVFQKQAVVAQLERVRKRHKECPPRKGYFEYARDGRKLEGIRWVEDEEGAVTIYEEPKRYYPYVIGGDTAGDGSDWFVGQVLDNTTGRQVARLRGRMDEDLYAGQMYALGMYYNAAMLGIEANFSTYPVRTIANLGYPRQYMRETEDQITRKMKKQYGFRTDSLTRPLMIAELVELAREHLELIQDEDTLKEMLVFVRNERGRPEAAAGEHDDCVMALAIAHHIRPQHRMTVLEPRTQKQKKLIEQIRGKR